MNKKERLDLAQWAVDLARKKGANDAAVDISNRRNIQVESREQKIEKLQESVSNSLDIKIYANQRYSSHSTNDLRKSELTRFIDDAVAMTKYLAADPYRTLPDPKFYKGQRDLDLKLSDDTFEQIDTAGRKKLAQQAEAAARGESDKVLVASGSYWDLMYHTVKVHSNGFSGEEEGTIFATSASVTVKDGEKGRPEGYYGATTRFLKDLPPAAELGKKATADALQKIGQTKLSSGTYDMLVRNRASRNLIQVIYSAMGGRALQQRSSFLEGKRGKKIASDKFTMVDNPFVVGGLGSQLFDSEGMAAKHRMLISKGMLFYYYIDHYYGQKLKMPPTTGSSSNICFELGEHSEQELMKKMDKGILVTGFIGGNSDAVTGDFSFGITGLYVEDGKIVKPVNEMNISGNMNDFMMNLEEMGNDPNLYSSWQCPSMYFKDVQFSGI